MSKHTSWRVGGAAKQFYKPVDLEDVRLFLASLPDDEPVLWIGLGSNLLVRDGGFNGTVVLSTPALKQMQRLSGDRVYAQAGVPCAKLARFAAAENLVGAEFFAGIPGTVGGALAMNAGAFGGETWEVVTAVETIDHRGAVSRRTPDAFVVGYRRVQGPEGEWFASMEITLTPGEGEQSRREMRRLLQQRGESQPTQLPNAGSVFRNPPGDYAARLIEAAGLKGKRVGSAEVSEKHANFIINTGGAKACHIEQLIGDIAAEVKRKFDVVLEPEVRIVGEAQG